MGVATLVAVLALTAWTPSASQIRLRTKGIPPDLGALDSLPLLTASDLTVLGGFRATNTFNTDHGKGCGLTYTLQGGLSMGTTTSRLFATSANCVVEMDIPALVYTSNPALMNLATSTQGTWIEPSEGNIAADLPSPDGDTRLGGVMYYINKLYFTGYTYYDTANAQVRSIWSHSATLATSSYTTMLTMWATSGAAAGVPEVTKVQGFVSGYMSPIPTQWQAALHGKALAGGQCLPIVSRTSSTGPAIVAFDPADVDAAISPVPVTPLAYYGGIGSYSGTSEVFNSTSCMTNVQVIKDTRTTLIIGTHGYGTFCYGDGQTPIESVTPGNCYDPEYVGTHGNHAWPYRYQMWFYDTADLAAVAAGTKLPTAVVPYSVTELTFPFGHFPSSTTSSPVTNITGMAYDETNHRLYVSQARVWPVGSDWILPVIWGINVDTTP